MRIIKLQLSMLFGFSMIYFFINGMAHAQDTSPDSLSSPTAGITVCMSDCDYSSIQEAINAANDGDTINLSSETYTETIIINKSITLLGKGSQDTILQAPEGQWKVTTRVISITSEVSVTIQGLTIRNGYASSENGGGIYNTGVLTLSESIVKNNTADFGSGGGIYSTGSLYIFDSLVQSNHASMGSGGGIYNISSHSLFNKVTLDKNYASCHGGGVYNASNDAMMTEMIFTSNSTGDYGGGGGLMNKNSNPQITNALFRNNSANYDYGGGAILNSGSHPIMTNIVILDNSAEYTSGAGMYNMNSQPTLINVTINGNSTGNNGGGIFNDNSDIAIINSIIWDNSSQAITGTAATSIFNLDSTPVISYSLIQGSGGSTAWVASLGVDGGNNLDADPKFVSNYNDLHLQADSPAINVGNNSRCLAYDLDGRPRPVWEFCDLGAYEFGYRSILLMIFK